LQKVVMSKISPLARHREAWLAMFASFALLAGPFDNALAASTPVTVANPATTPALTSSIDDHGRTAYQSATDVSCVSQSCQLAFPTIVPQGKRLVIQYISAQISIAGSGSIPVEVSLYKTNNPVDISHYFIVPATANTVAGLLSVFDQQVLAYFESGDTVHLGAAVAPPNKVGSMTASAFGYLLDCNVSPCAPIAH